MTDPVCRLAGRLIWRALRLPCIPTLPDFGFGEWGIGRCPAGCLLLSAPRVGWTIESPACRYNDRLPGWVTDGD